MNVDKRVIEILKLHSSLGIIYGDIGTSPLYVMGNMFPEPPSKEDVYGGVSLIIWALTMIAAIKYITIMLNFNNNGEGIFSLPLLLCSNIL
jgi:KUP system potassium uptake protein